MENNEMAGDGSMYGREETVCRVLVGRPERRRPLGRPRVRWILKWILKRWDVMAWTGLI
jgi:hypothetical protein